MKISLLGVKRNIKLAEQTTFQVGGRAKYFLQVSNKQQLCRALSWAKSKSLPIFVLGGGSNILFQDKPYPGLVIKIANNRINKIKRNTIVVGGGMYLPQLERKFLENSWTGLEWARGIPGTVGGAIHGNAGAFGHEIKELVKKVITIDPLTLEEKVYSPSQCKFCYRGSVFKENKEIIWRAELKFKKGKKKDIEEKSNNYWQYKFKNRHFFAYPSAGSIFKNIFIKDTPYFKTYHQLPNSIEGYAIIKGKKAKTKGGKLSTGWLIEQCGLKGKRRGKAMISNYHANVIVNLGGAKAADILYLINLCKKKVWENFGIKLEEEIIVANY